MRCLVTGAGGFMGSHLVVFLKEKGHEVLGTYYTPTTDINEIPEGIELIECDIRDKKKLKSIIQAFKPEQIYHLAAQSYPTVSWKKPNYTIEANVIGTINLFEVLKELNLKETKVMNAGSSAEYGYMKEDEVPVRESRELRPLHPYGVSKVAQENLVYQYYHSAGLRSVTFRIFNTTGPKKIKDVCADFTQQIAKMEKGKQQPTLKVGNLESKRAITDVRDLIRAFYESFNCCEFKGESYNLSGEKVYQIKEITEMLKGLTQINFKVEVDQKLLRPNDEPIIFGDSARFKGISGWKQEILLEKTLKDMLDYWRKK